MDLHELVSQLIIDTKGSPRATILEITPDSSIGAFIPELVLCATIVLMLLIRLFNWGRKIDAFYPAILGSAVAFYFTQPWDLFEAANVPRMEIFTGMLVYDPFTVFMRALFTLFAVLFAVFCKLSGIPDRENSPDIYSLVLGATVGLCLMASANHLLMVFMAVEMASVPSYALAGLLKGRRVSSEAALKYSVYGAGTAGVMLYGVSLVAGLLNTAHLPTMAVVLADELPQMASGELMVLALGGLMIMVGLAFKLSAVPFHFWCPDVFEGATAEVNAFLSVASKAAALALLVRVAIGFGAVPPEGEVPGARTAARMARDVPGLRETAQIDPELRRQSASTRPVVAGVDPAASDVADVTFVAARQIELDEPEAEVVEADEGWRDEAIYRLTPIRSFIAKLIALIAVVTCTFGNLAAYGQTNIKRMLAYSTIAHAGYMMMAVPPMLVMTGLHSEAAQNAIGALGVYLGIYLFMNLGAFAIIAFLRNAMYSEEIADYAGLIRRCPITVICFCLILFSLIGLPPLAGFIGKFAIFAALVDGYQVSEAAGVPAGFLLAVLVAGGLNTALSLFYYLRVAKVMTIDPEPADRRPVVFSDVSLQGAYVWLITLPTIGFIINWEGLLRLAEAAARDLLP